MHPTHQLDQGAHFSCENDDEAPFAINRMPIGVPSWSQGLL